MELPRLFILAAIAAAAFLINVPLGRLRSRQPKLSFKWFLYIHLSIPVIYGLRRFAGIGYWAIPIFVAAAVVGQLTGGNYITTEVAEAETTSPRRTRRGKGERRA